MAKEPMRAKGSFYGKGVNVSRGDVFMSDDPIVKAFPDLFAPASDQIRTTVADAEPTRKRTRRAPKPKPAEVATEPAAEVKGDGDD